MSAIMLIFDHGGDQEHEVVFVGQGSDLAIITHS